MIDAERLLRTELSKHENGENKTAVQKVFLAMEFYGAVKKCVNLV